MSVLSPAGPFPALFEAPALPMAPWVSMAILGILVCGAVLGAAAMRRRPVESATDASVATRLAIGLLPAVALGLLALGGTPVYFAGRTESMVWALAAALVAILVLGLPPVVRRIIVGTYAIAGAVTVAMWLNALPARPPTPGVEVGRTLAPMIEGGDRVVVAGLWQLEVRHGLANGLRDGSAVSSEIVDVATVPRSQAEHPGWLDRESVTSPELFEEARALRQSVESEQGRLWLIWSPALPLEDHFFPAFVGWQRGGIAASPVIAVDLLVPPPPEEPDLVDERVAR